VVEERPIISAKYHLPVSDIWPKLRPGVSRTVSLRQLSSLLLLYDCLLTSDPGNLISSAHSHGKYFVPSFIEFPPPSTEIPRHAKWVLTDNGRPDSIPENVMPLAAYYWRRRHTDFIFWLVDVPSVVSKQLQEEEDHEELGLMISRIGQN